MFPSQNTLQSFYNRFQTPQFVTPNLFSSNFSIPFPFNNPMATFPLIHPSFSNPGFPCLPTYQDATAILKLNQNMRQQMMDLQFTNLPKVDYDFNQKINTPLSLSSKSQLASPESEPVTATKNEPGFLLDLPNDPEIRLEAQIKYLIQFFVTNAGVLTNKEMRQAKQRYENDTKLTAIFNALQAKYSATTKTREEMIKWIVRRSLKTTKKSLKQKQSTNKKKLLNEICKKYFNEEEQDSGDDLVDSVLPFRKHSKNKTMNTNFITEIFQSEGFKQDYKEFLKDYDEIAEAENAEKIRRFTRAIMECTKKDNYEVIAKYKRVPWLKVWIQNTKIVAFELDEGDFVGKSSKKLRTH